MICCYCYRSQESKITKLMKNALAKLAASIKANKKEQKIKRKLGK